MNRLIVIAWTALLLAGSLKPASPAEPEDLSFCKEVLILHHSHVDVGYTHPQSMYWELQKDYLNAALDMLDRTEDWPDDLSRPRWTAEATAPVMRWLETATPEEVARLKRHVRSGRFGISGFEYNTTPLCSAESLARQLYHVRTLREKLGADIRTVNQHDVTGLPWTAVDLLLDADSPNVVTQWQLKAHPAYDGKPLSDFLLRKELHLLAGNSWQSWNTEGVLIVNPTGLDQTYYVPGTWQGRGKQIEPRFMGVPREPLVQPLDNLYGPVRLERYSWQILPWSALKPAAPADSLRTGPDFIETDDYRLTFDPAHGTITGLFDKRRSVQIVPADSPWGFFQLVHERPANNDRHAFHVRSVEGERYGRTGWKPDWQAVRTSYTGEVRCKVEKHSRSATLVLQGQAEGLDNLEQRVTLHADSPMIDLAARFLKQDVRTPEAVYFVFPLNLAADWKADFDTAGIPTELDAQQIPGSCRDWVTADTFASVHRPDFGVTLYCPDAPLVQIGDFNWAKKQDAIPRRAHPLLVAWPVNNYWETNFRASQPGLIELRYRFTSHGRFDPVRAVGEGQQACNPPVTHPVFDAVAERRGRFVAVEGERVVITPARKNLIVTRSVSEGKPRLRFGFRLINFRAGVISPMSSRPTTAKA